MIASLAVAGVIVLAGLGAAHLAGAFWFRREARRRECAPPDRWPRVAILMSLRGLDPTLPATLRGLRALDYPDFDAHIVLDSATDPAGSLVGDFEDPRFHLHTLASPPQHSSHICAAMADLLDGLPQDTEVVAVCDAETAPDPAWLKRLVATLIGTRSVAVSGQAFFDPGSGRWPSLIRSLWAAGAVVAGTARGYLWAGSLAFRLDLAREIGLSSAWRRAAVHDGALRLTLAQRRLPMTVRPSLVMIHREECDLALAANYIERVIRWAGLYFDGFGPPVGVALLMSGVVLVETAILATALLQGTPKVAAVAAAGLALFYAALAGSYRMVRDEVRRIDAARARPAEAPSARSGAPSLTFLAALPATTFVHAAAALRAVLIRRVTWRQVDYELRGPFDVRVVSSAPFRADPRADPKNSL